ncbi:MAG: LysR family transcriptional regulator [Gammaproteobacteria bacterium]|nr:LysR family transcriptional regulator [Gammaproteobacteria bacterium]
MRLEWLLDLLAIMDNDSLNRAAKKRFLSQPAFSRRIRVIEKYFGTELLDRSRKPARLKPRVLDQKQKIHELVNGIHELMQEFQRKDDESLDSLVIASQHSITTAVAPGLIKQVSSDMDMNIRLRSANRDECYALLMTKQAEIMLVYCSQNEALSNPERFLDHCNLGNEHLIPVCASSDLPRLEKQLKTGEISIVAYPSDVFFGTVMNREIFPTLRQQVLIRKNIETALSTAALQCALTGVGVAWIPDSLAKTELSNGRLSDLCDRLPVVKLSVMAMRLNGSKSPAENRFWEVITENRQSTA